MLGLLVKTSHHSLLRLGMRCSRFLKLSKFPLRNQSLFWRVSSVYYLWFFSCSLQYTFFVMYAYCLSFDMLLGFSCQFDVLCASCICMVVFLISLGKIASMIFFFKLLYFKYIFYWFFWEFHIMYPNSTYLPVPLHQPLIL